MHSIISVLYGGFPFIFLKGFMISGQNREERAFPLKCFFPTACLVSPLSLEAFQKYILCIYRFRYLYGKKKLFN